MLLTDNDRNALEACDENGVTNVGRIFALLDNFVEEGVQQGRFSREEADADLEIALWRSFALLQCDDYASYAQAVEVLQKAEAAAAGSGVWHYRLAAALTPSVDSGKPSTLPVGASKQNPAIPGDGSIMQSFWHTSGRPKLHRLPFKEALSSCRVTRNS